MAIAGSSVGLNQYQNLVFTGPSLLSAANEVQIDEVPSLTIIATFTTNDGGDIVRFGKLSQRGWIVFPEDWS